MKTGSTKPGGEEHVNPQKTKIRVFSGDRMFYKVFNDELVQYFAAHGQRYLQAYRGEVPAINARSVQAFARESEQDLLKKQSPKAAKEWKDYGGWVTIAGQKVFMSHVCEFVHETLSNVCEGEALEMVKRVSPENVGDLFEEFRTRFAKVEPEDIELLIIDLLKGTCSDGTHVNDSSNVVEWVARRS